VNQRIETVAITGATGALGRPLALKLESHALSVRRMSRRVTGDNAVQVDLNNSSGLVAALERTDAVVHLASSARDRNFSGDALQTKNLLDAAKEVSVRHFFYVSIVGIDRIPFSYYKTKLACENLVRQSSIPYTIIRATQFHEFIDELLHRAHRWGGLWLPKSFRFQTVDTEALADHLMLSIQRAPTMAIENIGGPEISTFGDMAKIWLAIRSLSNPVINLPLVGKVAAGFRRGYNTTRYTLPKSMTWEEWLIRKYGIDTKKFETTEVITTAS